MNQMKELRGSASPGASFSDGRAMTGHSPVNRYDDVAIFLHWLVALGVFLLIGMGWYMSELPRGTPDRAFWFNLHKSVGITLGLLVLVRIGWRLRHRPPEIDGLRPWRATAARVSHGLLYACLLIMPAVGFVASNFTRYGVKFFGVEFGPMFSENLPLRDTLQGVHRFTSYVLVTAIVVHVTAALMHRFVDDNGVLDRMLPRGLRRVPLGRSSGDVE